MHFIKTYSSRLGQRRPLLVLLPSCAAALHAHLPHPLSHALQAVDQVFTFERWNRHRRSYRYAKHLANMFSSRVFRQLLGPVLAVMALALFVGVYETLVNVRRTRSLHINLGGG